jgi:hypothetical protein
MTCFAATALPRASHSRDNHLNMRNILTCMLLIAGACPATYAARTPEQRQQQSNPYLILPPGIGDSIEAGHVPESLGSRTFVRALCC